MHLVSVQVSDGRYYGAFDVIVTAAAVDEIPEFRSNAEDTISYQENGVAALYTYQATDSEGSKVAWGFSGDDADAFDISDDGFLTFLDPPGYEEPDDLDSDNVHEVPVQATDETAHTRELEATVTVTNLTD